MYRCASLSTIDPPNDARSINSFLCDDEKKKKGDRVVKSKCNAISTAREFIFHERKLNYAEQRVKSVCTYPCTRVRAYHLFYKWRASEIF